MAADTTYQPKVQRRSGGDLLAIASGGAIDIESGGELRIAGTAVTASAAELNAVAGTGLDATELGYLNGVVAGTAAASKAAVLGATKNLDTIVVTNIDAGASGSAGTVDVFPATAAKGKLAISVTDQTGDTTVGLVIGAMGAARTVTLRDPGAAASILTSTDGTAAATTATAVEISQLAGVVAGTVTASKALVVGATKNLDVLVVADGGLSLGSTAIAATAAEINNAADISAMAAVAANGATLAVVAATHAGKVIQFGTATGTIVTLPAATGTGHVYRFVIGTAATSNANIIKVANATDVMDGSVNLQADADVNGTLKMWLAAVGDDTMTFAGAATSGGIVGGYIECTDYKAGFWACRAFTASGGGAEATPFSATVA